MRDVLRGPAHGLSVPQERRRDCICIARRHNIEQWKLQRVWTSTNQNIS
jgi:hypothetical protein